MRQEWEPEDLIEVWTLLEDDMGKLRNKSGANRLGFALFLKFFEVEARFPESAGEVPAPAVSYLAQQVKVPTEEWSAYDWAGRAIKRHRVEIREAYGFRICSEEDQAQLAEWLAAELCPVELSRDRLAEAVVARCRKAHMEPPAPGQVARLVGSAVSTFEDRFCQTTTRRLSAATRSRLDDLVAEDDGQDGEEKASVGGGQTFFTELKADPAGLGLESLLGEITKLHRVRNLDMPAELFADVSEKQVAAWRARRRSTPLICGTRSLRCATRCCPRCAMCVRRRSRTRWWICSSSWCRRSTRGRRRRSRASSSRSSRRSAARSP
uniref:DUF4158 domain-containing protein n=1 Tax=Streptomyces polyasparticus TaxID=2767826 RepID=UPI001BE473DB|nr:DUF4158 domain-containing protein [Streptomyces polyasparticus]